jgi:hypothetical protein
MTNNEAEQNTQTGDETANVELAANREDRERKAAADSLRCQIEQLKEGRPPRSLNEFVEQRMSEQDKPGAAVD